MACGVYLAGNLIGLQAFLTYIRHLPTLIISVVSLTWSALRNSYTVQVSKVSILLLHSCSCTNAVVAVSYLINNVETNTYRYVCCAEMHKLKSGVMFQLIVCMSPAMSLRLMHATRLSIDMSFKWVSGKWEEFEIETWDNDHMQCKSFICLYKL